MTRGVPRLRIVLLFVLLLGCASTQEDRTDGGVDMIEELMQADRDFALATEERGIDGWMSFFAEDAARMELGGKAVRGLEAIRTMDGEMFASEDVLLTWSPVSARVFEDGRHGFTTGSFELLKLGGDGTHEVLGTGSYISIWRRVEGAWKVILDTGAPDPPEK